MIALFVALGGLANAAPVTATYCVTYTTDFTDAGTGDLMTGDIDLPAYGVRLRFTNETTSAVTMAFTDWDGADPGCADVELDNADEYTVAVARKAEVNGNTIEVKAANGAPLLSQVAQNFVPSQSGDYAYDIGPSNSVNVIYAASFALQRRAVGASGETFVFIMDECPAAAGTSCYSHSSEQIYIVSGQAVKKFIVLHELGHNLADVATGFAHWVNDDSADVDRCTSAYTNSGHKMNSKEYNSIAITEGIAHFYAAIVTNYDTSQTSDCDMEKHYNPDWDANGITNGAEDTPIFSCDVGFTAGGFTVVGNNYIHRQDSALYTDVCVSTGQSNNRATEYDWLRHFWTLRTYQQFSGAEIFEIFAAASPDTWEADGNGQGGDYPSQRMYDAAFTVGGGTMQWDYVTSAIFHGTNQ